MVSSSWTVGIILASSHFCSQVSNFILSSASSNAHMLQQRRQYTNILSNALLLLLPIKAQSGPLVRPRKHCVKLDILPMLPSFITSEILRSKESKQGPGSDGLLTPTHLSMVDRKNAWCSTLDLLRTHASNTGLQSRSVPLT